MKDFRGKVAVITGAASGLGRGLALEGARRGMKLVLADIQQDALDHACAQLHECGAQILPVQCDVRKEAEVQALADIATKTFGAVHLVFNNAGVATTGLLWENTPADWEWVLGVNLWGVVHGVRTFTPIMLDAAGKDASYQGHIVNTASMAGLLTAPAMGVYNVSKQAVISLTETLYHDLHLIEAPIGVSLLCPYFLPTGISRSERNRPADVQDDVLPTASKLAAQAIAEKAVASGKMTVKRVAEQTFEAIEEGRFYIYSHPQLLEQVRNRLDNMVRAQNPQDPYQAAPHIREMLLQKMKEV